MTRITSVHRMHHGNTRVRADRVEAQSATARMIPVVTTEFLKAATQYPIVFTKNAETGKFICVVLCGFEADENLFWRNNEWDAIYVPLNVRRQPFFLGSGENGGADDDGGFVLCIDEESACIQDGAGETLFDGQGNETPYLQAMRSILAQLVDGEVRTNRLIERLLKHDLLTELTLKIELGNGESLRVQGLYTIDEAKLEAASADMLVELHGNGDLALIYAMIVSIGQIFGLVQRKNAALAKASQWFTGAPDADNSRVSRSA